MTQIKENPVVSSDQILRTLQERVYFLEGIVTKLGYEAKGTKKKRFRTKKHASVLYGMSRALCVETVDPWTENRIRFYHPQLHNPKTPILSLPFAQPVSAMGGIDDSGLSWVPPAGSSVVIFFEGGVVDSAFYIGTTWHRNRGVGGKDFPVAFREWDIYRGHRKGYICGPNGSPNDESQVLPPWNTENRNSKDINDFTQFITDPAEQKKSTFPHIYGFKTPEKHMVKMVDGDPKCNRRYKRFEIMSGGGHWMIFKDDHLHYGGMWAHPSCTTGGSGGTSDLGLCAKHDPGKPYYTNIIGTPYEKPVCDKDCKQDTTVSALEEGSSVTIGQDTTFDKVVFKHTPTPGNPPNPTTKYYREFAGGKNPYFKHRNECRPYNGPGTPQNNKCSLPQAGIQFLSISGHTLIMDDSVEEPRGKPEWERSTEPFDFGCNNKYLGLLYMKSATGHSFVMSDVEKDSKVRGDQNYIELRTANGSYIQLNDHTVKNNAVDKCGTGDGQQCPPDYAGEKRGIHLVSTSNHVIKMIDHLNEQCGSPRKEGGTPISKAKAAYIQIRSGYGLEMRYNDDFSQEQTQSQWIQILHPQCVGDSDPYCNACESNECRGPHILRFQGRPKGTPGLVYLRAGGHAVRQTYDMDIVLVGDKEKNPSDKFTYVSKRRISATEDIDFRYSGELHIFFAEKQILLMAGRDCPPPPGKKCRGPCLYNVIVARCPVFCPLTGILHWTEKAMSERVFASAYHPCQVPCGGGGGCPEMTPGSGKGCVENA